MPDPAFLIGGICEGRRVPAVTIFGWDDVLCPTTHARQQQEKVQGRRRDVRTSRLERKELLQLGQSVVRLVKAARRHGPVVIVTKSQERWVRGTAELLLPGGAAAACLDNVEIVSSSDRFGGDFPNQPACWQIAALSYVTNRYLLSAGALARVRLADAAAAVAAATAAAGAQEVEGRTAGEGGSGGGRLQQEAGVSLERGETGGEDGGSSRQPQGGGGRRRVLRRTGNPGTSGTGSSDGDSDGDGGASGIRPRGTLIAVATASRSWENKSAALTLREHHPDVVAKTVSLVEAPSPLELRNQLDLLADNFEQMFGHCLLPQGQPQGSSPAVAPAPAAPALPAPAPALPAPALVEAALALPAAPPAPAPAPAPEPAPPAPATPVTPAPPASPPAPPAPPAPAPPEPAPPAAPVIVPTLELPLKLWQLEEGEEEESRSRRVQPGLSRHSSVVGGDNDGDDNGDGDGEDDGGRGRCGSFWGSASSCTSSSPASATVCAPLAGATDVDLPSNDTAAAVAGVFGLPAIVLAAPGGGETPPPKYQKGGKQHLTLWSNDGSGGGGGGGNGDDDDDDEEYLTAVCSESTMSSNVSSLTGEVGAGGGLPFAVEGPELLSPPLGWAAAASAPPNPPPRLHRRRSKPKAVAVE